MKSKASKPPLVVMRDGDSHIELDRETRTDYAAFHADAGLLGIRSTAREAEDLIREYRTKQLRAA